MKLPEGRLVRSRVVERPGTVLADALDRRLTGYAVLEPQGALLLDEAGRGVLTFVDGVPRLAYHTATERGGPPALADIAASGPYHLELVAVSPGSLADVHEFDSLRVPPEMAARRLAGDPSLVDRTRAATEAEGTPDASGDGDAAPRDGSDEGPGAVEAFLDDADKIEAIREAAREEAHERAAEWGFDV
jgi:hypothetical protein